MRNRFNRTLLLSMTALSVVAAGCGAPGRTSAGTGTDNAAGAGVLVENQVSLGNGYVQTVYSRGANGAPTMIGVAVSESAMNSLPTVPTHDGNTCFDKDNSGKVDPSTECGSGHERVLWFPRLKGLPFQWIMFNWQAKGHGPAHVFDKPHFDLHFFIQDYESRNAIRTGPCGAVFVNCDDNATAMKPVPAPFNPIGFGEPGAAGRMGNHLGDVNAPPFTPGPFTQAFVYGTYDSHISFWETVFATDWLKTERPHRNCLTLKWAPEVEVSGHYPRKSCVSHRQHQRDYLMTFEDFAYRAAPAGTTPPDWLLPPQSTETAPQPDTGPAHSGHGTP
ncbi:hypothetical protein ALI144C_05280 [Actinosynnema sp. ALI-1.44]|uniref:hypothetical protein n=1 Tax=Actinosynnema sp. ALI-1.44 TaxID=1933779 RepID=UPI00097C64EC|nr:hypothetical protein [Actinosynnema sp. ALI-1.44]ONI89354.1 hypothetical protein ALI144C_05280 [Actinosynnema sp. ALI-1.44]